MNKNNQTQIKRSAKAEDILHQINRKTKLEDLRKIAKDLKKDRKVAMELWSSEENLPRLLAILIMDKQLISQEVINQLDQDMQIHSYEERNHLIDWLIANQLTKSKRTLTLLESWNNSPSSLQRRTFWYYQARLRWTGKIPKDNTEELLSVI